MEMKSIHENLRTLPSFIYNLEKNTPNNVFLRQPQGDNWKTYTRKHVQTIYSKYAFTYFVSVCVSELIFFKPP